MKNVLYSDTLRFVLLVMAVVMTVTVIFGCDDTAISKDKATVNTQQGIYQRVQPTPMYDYSIPRDVLVQIYNMVTSRAVATYTVVETMTGVTKFRGPSIGYPIPADTQLTNPLQLVYNGAVVEQAEPNGLYTSKNTDGTWCLFTMEDGTVVPIYSEHKVTAFPFPVEKNADGEWIKAGTAAVSIDTSRLKLDGNTQNQINKQGIK